MLGGGDCVINFVFDESLGIDLAEDGVWRLARTTTRIHMLQQLT